MMMSADGEKCVDKFWFWLKEHYRLRLSEQCSDMEIIFSIWKHI